MLKVMQIIKSKNNKYDIYVVNLIFISLFIVELGLQT